MKTIEVLYLGFLICAVVQVAHSEERLTSNDDINNTINALISSLPDPLDIAPFQFQLNNSIINGSFVSSGLNISGINQTVATYIDVHTAILVGSYNVTFNLKGIDFVLNYTTDVLLGNLLPFFGNGSIKARLDNLTINIYVENHLTKLRNIKVGFSVGEKTNFEIQGLMNNDYFSELINELLSTYISRGIDFLNTNKDTIGSVISSIIQSIVDSIQDNLTLDIDHENVEGVLYFSLMYLS
ncbi:uncharacterized protein LOC115876932 isoform X2 [Sitophilus oryzae]|uniref:Uncharacterized protein LOC115876932 isoform X2 n=1 Tax=Sitophilus oryzae TaxID=7048 RepID=A0A6J2XC79_SITOR|nr:uncharacterized protein LOC115876932 isoform X2 [Sitophilus oryzae]